MYCYVWSYAIRPEYLQEFRLAYGERGQWVQLFRRHPAYIRTHLLADCSDATRFMTIDFWTSRRAFDSFRKRFSAEFEKLDQEFASYTLEEEHLGDFDTVGENGASGPLKTTHEEKDSG